MIGLRVLTEEYFKELALIKKQYGQEEDYYFIINLLIRIALDGTDLCVRDVHNCDSTIVNANGYEGRKAFIAYGQTPDFVILKECFNQRCENQKKYVIGAVEIKNSLENKGEGVSILCNENNATEFEIKDLEIQSSVVKFNKDKDSIEVTNKNKYEIIKELMGYKRLIVTDGIEWIFLEVIAEYNCRNEEKTIEEKQDEKKIVSINKWNSVKINYNSIKLKKDDEKSIETILREIRKFFLKKRI